MLRTRELIERVHVNLPESSALRGTVTSALTDHGIDIVDDPLRAHCIVALGDHLGGSQPPVGEDTCLMQLADCGGAQYATEVGNIVIANASHVLAGLAAEWCLGELLSAADATGKTIDGSLEIGIVGLGNLGSHLAEALKGSVGKIWIADVRTPRQQLLTQLGVRRLTLDLLLTKSDIVFVCAHHGPTADPLISARELRLMRRGAALVNPSGSLLVDQAALGDAVASGRLAYAAQRQDDAHLADAEQRADEIASYVVDNINRINQGEPVRGIVEPVDFPSAGDPAFWSSRMSPTQTAS